MANRNITFERRLIQLAGSAQAEIETYDAALRLENRSPQPHEVEHAAFLRGRGNAIAEIMKIYATEYLDKEQ